MRSGLKRNEYHHYEAVNHTSVGIKDIEYLAKLFNRNAFGSETAIIAEALSHLTLWRHIASTQNEMHLVLTDEAVFVDGWVMKWNDEHVDDLPHDAFV